MFFHPFYAIVYKLTSGDDTMIELNFHQAMDEWLVYCKNPRVQFSSSAGLTRDCDSYKEIVSMGYDALPLIRPVYDRDSSDNLELSMVQGHGLVYVVREIIGDNFSIPADIRGQISAMEDYTKRWLDDNMDKYVATK